MTTTKKNVTLKRVKVEKPTSKVATTKKSKATKAKVIQEVTPRNKTSLIEKVISNREVKYIYPPEVSDTLSRKSWRQTVRNKLDKLERDFLRIEEQNSKEFKAAKKAYEAYRDTVIKA